MYHTGCCLRYNWYVGAAAKVWKIVKKKWKENNLIYIFHQHEQYFYLYIIQLFVIHSPIRLKSKQTHIIISVLNLGMLNYTTIIDIFVLQ
jgi:hypothetical protein